MSERIRGMFDAIAPRYDLVNAILSLGQMPRWRRLAVARSSARLGQSVLDCASGTGALAIEFARAVGPAGNVIGLDISAEMLAFAQAKAQRRSLPNMQTVQGDMLVLPYADGSFDCASVCFGVRNTDDPARALAEMARVVRPGGSIVVLETGLPDWQPWRAIYGLFNTALFPLIGGAITGEWAAYRHLRDSIRVFPYGQAFVEMLRGAGEFKDIQFWPLLGGVVWLYVGRR